MKRGVRKRLQQQVVLSPPYRIGEEGRPLPQPGPPGSQDGVTLLRTMPAFSFCVKVVWQGMLQTGMKTPL
jgi:hypothetical protein